MADHGANRAIRGTGRPHAAVMRAVLALIVCAAFALGTNAAAFAADGVAGRYQSTNGFTLELKAAGDGAYTGRLSVAEATGDVRLRSTDEGLVGILMFQGQPANIAFRQRGDAWVLTDGQMTIAFTRQAPPRQQGGLGAMVDAGGAPEANAGSDEAGDGDGADTADRAGEPDPIQPGWKRYKHPIGGAFDHPTDWRVVEQQGMLMLVPPDFRQGQEFMSVFGGPAQGVTSASDAQVAQFMDNWMRQLNPAAQRAGEPAAAETRVGPGAVYTYRGPHPATGEMLTARVYVVIANDLAVGFSLIGNAQTIARRQPVVDKVFTSFHVGAARLDRSLLGAWHGEAIYRHDAEVSANTHFTYHFREDGTIISGARSAVNVALQGENQEYTGTRAGGGNQNVKRGNWSAVNGRLTILWDDGSQRVTHYVVRGQTLEFRQPDGKLIDYMER